MTSARKEEEFAGRLGQMLRSARSRHNDKHNFGFGHRCEATQFIGTASWHTCLVSSSACLGRSEQKKIDNVDRRVGGVGRTDF